MDQCRTSWARHVMSGRDSGSRKSKIIEKGADTLHVHMHTHRGIVYLLVNLKAVLVINIFKEHYKPS